MTAPENSDNRRKKILWRATHRGIREMDLIVGGFAKARVEGMTEAELAALEAIIELPDQELLAWATKKEPVPHEHASAMLLEMLDLRT